MFRLRELKKWVKQWKSNRLIDKKVQYVQTFQDSFGSSASTATVTAYTNSTAFNSNLIDQLTHGVNQEISEAKKLPDDLRIEKKPVEVVNEILTEKPVIQVNDIKMQIEVVEARLKVLKRFRGNTNDEEKALRYLNARKYFKKYEKMFPWAVSTNAMIEALIKKYKLADRSFGGYSKSVPMEATIELEKFGKAWEKVVDDDTWQPSLKLITDYKGPETKKDPILLASSPFGDWWYVLGAWDKEVQIVDQIIYHGK